MKPLISPKEGQKLVIQDAIDCWAILSKFIVSEDLRWSIKVGHGTRDFNHHVGLSVDLFCGIEHYQTARELWSPCRARDLAV